MKFVYEGLEQDNAQPVQGEIDAVSDLEALRTLQGRRIEVIKLAPLEEKSGKKRRVEEADLVLPLQELATLTASGVSLLDAISALAKNKEHAGLAQGFRKIASLIESGESFSAAIAQSALPFPPYLKHLVSAGEVSGELALALRNASSQMNYDQAIRNDLKSALTYPLVLIGAGIAAMLIIFYAVVPKFSHMLDGSKELPTLAWAVLSAGKLANEHPWWLGSGTAALLVSVLLIAANPKVRHRLLNAALNFPVVGPWLAEQDAARWASLCGAMLSARVDLVTALRLAAESSVFTLRKRRALAIIQDIQSGVSLTESLARSQLLPGTSLNLVSVGDKTGQLAPMMQAVAALHDESCKRRMKQVLTLIEPIAILIVGVLIGIMILGIVLAITASTDIAI